MDCPNPLRLPDPAALGSAVKKAISRTGVPGAGVAISLEGHRVVATEGLLAADQVFPLTEHARFRIGCFITFLVALVTLKLADSGHLDLQAPIIEYLPELAPIPKARTIRVAHLLSRTSGCSATREAFTELGPYETWDWDKFVKFFGWAAQIFEPGSVLNFEPKDYVLLGRILRQVTGCAPGELVKEDIFRPLQIEARTVREREDNCYVFGHYGSEKGALRKVHPFFNVNDLWSASGSNLTLTLADLLTIGESLVRCGAGPALLSPAAENVFRAPVIPVPTSFSTCESQRWLPQAFTVASATFRNGAFGYFAAGMGQNCGIVLDFERRLTVAFGINVESGIARSRLLDAVFTALSAAAANRERTKAGDNGAAQFDAVLSPFTGADLVGRFRGPLGGFISSAKDTRIQFKPMLSARGSGFSIWPDDKGNFRISPQFSPPIGVFADPRSGSPCFMYGLNAYKKVG